MNGVEIILGNYIEVLTCQTVISHRFVEQYKRISLCYLAEELVGSNHCSRSDFTIVFLVLAGLGLIPIKAYSPVST